MPSTSITIKPNNHRAYTCPNTKKAELVKELVSQNSEINTVVVCSNNKDSIKESLKGIDVVVMDDKEFIGSKELKCDMLISYNVPDKAIIYMARVAKATLKAVILVDEQEQKKLYPIETLLGRTIKQEILGGFEYEIKESKQTNTGHKRSMSKEQIREVAQKRYKEKTDSPKKESFNKPQKEYKKDFKKSESSDKWAKKNKSTNKYLGKDENGKAIFSGKSGERNHRYDGTPRDKYDAPKKVGRKINIKSLKKSDKGKD